MKAVLFAAGELKPGEWLQRHCREASLLIAVDGGLRHALDAGIKPHLITGDLDSATAADLRVWEQLPKQLHPVDKSETDLELALAEAERRGAKEVLVAGALGGRQDHSLTNLLLAVRWQQQGRLSLSLAGAGTIAWPLTTGELLRLPAAPGTVFSVVAAEAGCRVSIHGARYPLHSDELPFGTGLGISNVVETSAQVSVERGSVLVMVLNDEV